MNSKIILWPYNYAVCVNLLVLKGGLICDFTFFILNSVYLQSCSTESSV